MRRREIFIELTSLLDVMLILLFVLLTQARTQTGAALSEAADARSRIESLELALADAEAGREALEERANALERRAITIEVVEENSLIVTLSVQDRGARVMTIESDEGDELRFVFDPEDETYAANKLRSSLSELMRRAGKETVFVVFQYDRSTIYQTEYALIGGVVRDLKQEARSAGVALNYIETDIRSGEERES